MPRGEHLKKVSDEEILRQFDRVDIQRSVYSAAEIAQGLEITDEAVRQRLHKMKGEEVETEKIAGTTLWKRKGQEVFAGKIGFANNLFPTIAGLEIPLYGAITMILFGLVLTAFAGAPFNPLSFILALLIGSAGGAIYIFTASLAIGYYKKHLRGTS